VVPIFLATVAIPKDNLGRTLAVAAVAALFWFSPIFPLFPKKFARPNAQGATISRSVDL